MRVLTYLYNIISGRTGEQRSVDNILAQGAWRFIQLSNYTLADPLSITQGNTTKLTFQPSDISFTDGRGLVLNYDYTSQKFMPQTSGDVFLVEVRFKAKCSAPNGAYELKLESPSFAFNPVQAQSGSISKSAGVEQFISLSVPIFIGQDIKNNGLGVFFKAESGNFTLYDVSFMIVRLTSGIPNSP